jgi:hypothetical protein
MLLIPVVLVIGGILALVLYLEKRLHPIDSKATARAHAQAAARRLIWLPRDILDKLNRLRGSSESYSDVILRLAAEASERGR